MTEKAAKPLAKEHPLASLKIYRALGLRILDERKSKYYRIAVDHFEQVMKLSKTAGVEKEWEALVQRILEKHSRKISFIRDFKKMVAGKRTRSRAVSRRKQPRDGRSKLRKSLPKA